MIDASRNGVPHVASLEQRVSELALLGINQLTLSTEDTYEVKGHTTRRLYAWRVLEK